MPTAEVSTGLRMMAQIAVIITIASGFAGVLQATGEIDPLIRTSADLIGGNMTLGDAGSPASTISLTAADEPRSPVHSRNRRRLSSG